MKELLVFWALCSLVGNLLAERPPLIQQPIFSSTNFENIFTWKSWGEPLPGTVYDVQYKKYGDAWQNKSECQNITRRSCNLTLETENFTECYYARVRATVPNCCVSKWVESSRFYPRENTIIGSPDVKYTPSVNSIKFYVQPPATPLRDKDNQTLTVVDIFSQIGMTVEYELTIHCQKTKKEWVKVNNNNEFEISDLYPNTEYNGTIHIRYSDKTSKPYVFWAKTLSDTTWFAYLFYLFAVALIAAVLIFGTIYYFIYKYIKQHTAQQPTSLDFKDILHFQPLVPRVEQILNPYDSCKPVQLTIEKDPTQITQLGALEDQGVFSLPETAYQKQANAPLFQTIARPVGYTPQMSKNKPPCTQGPSPLTYGVCFEGTSSTKANSSANQARKLGSLAEGSLSSERYKAQMPEQIKRELWGNKPPQMPVPVLGDAERIQCLLLQEDMQDMPQLLPPLLEERVPATTGEETGSYRKQPAELQPSAVEFNQNAISGGNLLSSMPPSLFSHRTCSSLIQDQNPGQWVAWDLPAWTNPQHQPLGFPVSDSITQVSNGLENKPGFLGTNPDTLDSAHSNGLFTSMFRDLELKVQWDQAPEENADAQ
ncbi:interleukin-22 receptor subunit alpha-1 [Zootoca vivipara]|uniref:interleukin-22 receptor subunit alpha-1 n=1 Tax=Zootoca vivipara TaxID=8524 RepID=UPI00293BAA98|nr:interleukin-22 receptor subunit alpha-1 [Zootoca vivipara]